MTAGSSRRAALVRVLEALHRRFSRVEDTTLPQLDRIETSVATLTSLVVEQRTALDAMRAQTLDEFDKLGVQAKRVAQVVQSHESRIAHLEHPGQHPATEDADA